jgi:thymidylate kinase
MPRGWFIVVNGINNLGKTTQLLGDGEINGLVNWLNNLGVPAEYVKCPFYHLPGTGPLIEDYIRNGNTSNLKPDAYHTLQAYNKFQYQRDELRQKLDAGITVVSEGWAGSGIAWGLAEGAPRCYLDSVNSTLIKPDLELLFEGKRFIDSKEQGHHFEEDFSLMTRSAEYHHQVGQELGWRCIKSGLDRRTVMFNVRLELRKAMHLWW